LKSGRITKQIQTQIDIPLREFANYVLELESRAQLSKSSRK